MTDGDPGHGNLADEAEWTSIPDDDEVWARPTRQPPPLADPAPPLLNTHEMDRCPLQNVLVGALCKHHFVDFGVLQEELNSIEVSTDEPTVTTTEAEEMEEHLRGLGYLE